MIVGAGPLIILLLLLPISILPVVFVTSYLRAALFR